MQGSFESAYVYARICGAVKKAYLGEKAAALARHARVGEAWQELFHEAPPALPEEALLSAAEAETRIRALREFRSLSVGLERELPFFAALLRKSEFAYAKSVAVAVEEGRPLPPQNPDPGTETEFRPEHYPDLGRMFMRTRFAWIVEEGRLDLTVLKNRIDRQYHAELWESSDEMPARLSEKLRDLLALEAEIANLVWGLRLRRYYAMGRAEIEGLLIRLPGRDVARCTLQALGFKSDKRGDWVGWKWERLLPDAPPQVGSEWYLDVRELEASARRYLFRVLRRSLHFNPFGYLPLYVFFRIKEIESSAINGVLEGIHLEAPVAEISAYALAATGAPA